MRFISLPKDRVLRRALALTGSLLLALSAGACRQEASNARLSGTPSGETLPRTTLRMPPVPAPGSANTPGLGFTRLDSRRMTLADYQGHVVVLDFYATWCPPCREEAPHLVDLQRRYGPQGLRIVGLNVGGPDDRDKVPEFVEQFKIQYELAIPDPEMSEIYFSDNTAIPQTYVFDRKGRLIKRFIGFDASMPAELEATVRAALEAGAD